MAIRAFAAWLIILLLAVLNGALREGMLIPRLGARAGLVMSGLLLSGLVLATTWLLLPWIGARTQSQQLALGLGWLVLTLAFEFSFGLLRGRPLSEILSAYTFKGGNLWIVVLLVTAASPWLAARLRGW